MILARRQHTVGDRRRYVLDYAQWLGKGVTVSTASVISSSATCTVDDVTTTEDKIVFFLNGGTLNESFTISVAMTDTRSEIKNDTLVITVLAP